MALPVPVPNALKVQLLWTDGNDTNVITGLHFAYAGDPPSGADCANIANAIDGLTLTHLIPLLSVDATMRGTVVIDLSSDLAHSGESDTPNPGTLAGAVLPAATAVLVNYGISRRYRGGKPRSYFPFGTAPQLGSPSKWLDAFVTNVSAALNAWNTGMEGIVEGTTSVGAGINISYNQGYGTPRTRSNGHLYYPPQPRVTPIVEPIISRVVNPKPSSQRRRNQHSS